MLASCIANWVFCAAHFLHQLLQDVTEQHTEASQDLAAIVASNCALTDAGEYRSSRVSSPSTSWRGPLAFDGARARYCGEVHAPSIGLQ